MVRGNKAGCKLTAFSFIFALFLFGFSILSVVTFHITKKISLSATYYLLPDHKDNTDGSSISFQFSSVAQLCTTLWDSMTGSTPGLPVHHQLPEFTETHIDRFSDAIQPSHPLSSLSPPAPNPSQHQSLFQCVNSSHEVAKVLEFQL